MSGLHEYETTSAAPIPIFGLRAERHSPGAAPCRGFIAPERRLAETVSATSLFVRRRESDINSNVWSLVGLHMEQSALDSLLDSLRDVALARACAALSEESFARIWDNEEDAIYDDL